jgi:murein DD-endopeptidase MepM/ murein hydrolase activator NlpD
MVTVLLPGKPGVPHRVINLERPSHNMILRAILLSAGILVVGHTALSAESLLLPTANQALFEKGGEERYFVGTVGKSWSSGTFGCVRSNGHQMHEGLDIRPTEWDRHGEPTDSVFATADGEVVYINSRPALSNYGIYLILRHHLDGIEIYSLYAHLAHVQPGLAVGQRVNAGESLGIMGHTANTKEGISKDRAHLHFELNLVVNDRFAEWHKKTFPGERNDHGDWNGQNLLGINPQLALLASHAQGAQFNLVQLIQSQPELCRVQVRKTNFPWLKRYQALIKPNPIAEKEGVAAYEMRLNFNGLPIELIPRAASELKKGSKYQLLSVNEAEYQKNPARKLVGKSGSRWQLASNGIHLLDLLTF